MIKAQWFIKIFFILLFSEYALSKEIYVVSIGRSIEQVQELAGKADSINMQEADEITGMGITQSHVYSGANLDFHKGQNGFYLWKVEINSSEWAYSDKRIKIGVNSALVLSVLGEPASKEPESNKSVWFYHFKEFDGWLRIEFQNDKLIKILAVEDWT